MTKQTVDQLVIDHYQDYLSTIQAMRRCDRATAQDTFHMIYEKYIKAIEVSLDEDIQMVHFDEYVHRQCRRGII